MIPSNNPAPSGILRYVPRYRPRVTYVMMGLLVVVFVIETLAGGSDNSRTLIQLGANFAPLVTTGDYWRLFTANFLHIGLMHLAFNLYALYIVGTEVEMFYGPCALSRHLSVDGLVGRHCQLRLHVWPVGGRVYGYLRLDRHAGGLLHAQSRRSLAR